MTNLEVSAREIPEWLGSRCSQKLKNDIKEFCVKASDLDDVRGLIVTYQREMPNVHLVLLVELDRRAGASTRPTSELALAQLTETLWEKTNGRATVFAAPYVATKPLQELNILKRLQLETTEHRIWIKMENGHAPHAVSSHALD